MLALRGDVQFVPLTAGLLAAVAMDERDPEVAGVLNPDDAAFRLARPELCEALVSRDRALAAAGVVPIVFGRAYAWALISRFATKRQIVMAVRHMAATLARLQGSPEFRRVEMAVRAGQPTTEAFARAVGMMPEGYMRAWHKGHDFWLYARVVSA